MSLFCSLSFDQFGASEFFYSLVSGPSCPRTANTSQLPYDGFVMPYYLHKCFKRHPAEPEDLWWVCSDCLSDYVPICNKCEIPAPVAKEKNGFLGYEYGKLCPICVKVAKEAGPWKERRRLAIQTRKNVLLERFTCLHIAKETDTSILLLGTVFSLKVEIRLKVKERDWERFIFHIECSNSCKDITIEDFNFPTHIAKAASAKSPTYTATKNQWLRVGFNYLGKLDILTVIEYMVKYVKNTQKKLDGENKST